jgi:hypothetical protein
MWWCHGPFFAGRLRGVTCGGWLVPSGQQFQDAIPVISKRQQVSQGASFANFGARASAYAPVEVAAFSTSYGRFLAG